MAIGSPIAVITGAAGGLGAGLAKVAADRGMRLVLIDRDQERLDATVQDIASDNREVDGFVLDVTDAASFGKLAEKVQRQIGPVELLINNAGLETLGYTWEISDEIWSRTINVNVLGVVNGIRAFAPDMIAAANPSRIVNIASVAAVGMMPLTSPYMASKQAVLAISESLKMEFDLKAAPVSVSVALPASIRTGIFDGALASSDPNVAAHRDIMQEMLNQHGIDAETAASRIFQGIDEGQFWISTDRDLLSAMATSRGQHIADLATPELTDVHRQLLAPNLH